MRRGRRDLGSLDPRAGAGAHWTAVEQGWLAKHSQPALAGDWLIDDAQNRKAPVHQGNQSSEDRPANDEAARPIDRIENPLAAGLARLLAIFLPDHAVLRSLRLEDLSHGLLGFAV